jgi:hypothetical protein
MADIMKEDDEKGGEEIIIVEDESKLSDNKSDDQEDDHDDGEDERTKSAAEEDDGDGNDDEREAIRERRRLEKLERKERRDQAIKRDKLELDFLRKRNDDLERRVTAQEQRAHQVDLSTYDTQIANAAKEAELAERVIAKAVEAGNGKDVAQALKYRDQAMQKVQQLQFEKNQAAQQRPTAQQLDDMTMHYAKEFMDENKWYDSQGRDEDSAIVIAIDQSLAKDGYNPQTQEYWDELRKRAARRLPEKFKAERRQARDDREERTPRGGPAVGSGREHAPATTRKEIYVSPERKQALIDAGVWDDPVLRMKYVKRYAEYDRTNKA